MRKRVLGSKVLLLGALLAMSPTGCKSLGKGPAGASQVQRDVVAGEEDDDDKGNGNGNGRDIVWALLDLEKKSERILSGEGFEEGEEDYRQWTGKKGIRRIEVDGPPRFSESYAFEIHPDGTKVISYGNGNPIRLIQETPGSRVYLIDRSGDGVSEERVSITSSPKTETTYEETRYVFEKRTPSGTWKLEKIIGTQSISCW